MADVMQRILALLVILQSGKLFTSEELVARLAVTPRTLRRDIDRLRNYGYPVEAQPGPGGYYRLAAGKAMPPLVLDDDEAVATLLGLAALSSTGSASEGSVDDAATRAYGKVDQYLPKRFRPRVAALRASLETMPTSAPSTRVETLTTLAEAIMRHHVVTFHYVAASGAATTRRVEPHRQVHLRLRWYLMGWDTDRQDWRVFRTDRITELRAQCRSFSPRPLPAESGIEYLRQGINKRRRRVAVLIHAPMRTVAEAFSREDVDLAAVEGGGTRAVLMLDSWQWMLPTLAFLDADFFIEEPAEFRAASQRFAARLVHG